MLKSVTEGGCAGQVVGIAKIAFVVKGSEGTCLLHHIVHPVIDLFSNKQKGHAEISVFLESSTRAKAKHPSFDSARGVAIHCRKQTNGVEEDVSTVQNSSSVSERKTASKSIQEPIKERLKKEKPFIEEKDSEKQLSDGHNMKENVQVTVHRIRVDVSMTGTLRLEDESDELSWLLDCYVCCFLENEPSIVYRGPIVQFSGQASSWIPIEFVQDFAVPERRPSWFDQALIFKAIHT